MSQADLGEKFGVTFQQVQKYEAGKNALSAGALAEFCEILGTNPNELLAWGNNHPGQELPDLSADQIRTVKNLSKLTPRVRNAMARAIRTLADESPVTKIRS